LNLITKPRHIAIIMDGNNRWAKKHGKFGIAGHQAGAKRVREVVEAVQERGIEALTIFAFSSENWRRPEQEVKGLMGLFQIYLEKEAKLLAAKGIKLRVIGARDRFSAKLLAAIDRAEDIASTGEMQLNIAVDYGGRWDIVNAAKKLTKKVQANELTIDEITEDVFNESCELGNQPAPDLLIRTGGEKRISNYLLWQCAYSEFYFSEELWPDFNAQSIDDAISEYATRQRRFGKTSEQVLAEQKEE